MTTLKETIKGLAAEQAGELVKFRRHLHAHPELSFQEVQTADFVTEKLRSFGLDPISMADTGVVAYVHGKNPKKKTLALRADMDALPIAESNEVPYKSTNHGVMHACGHDVHTSSLLGTAIILKKVKDSFEGITMASGSSRRPL